MEVAKPKSTVRFERLLGASPAPGLVEGSLSLVGSLVPPLFPNVTTPLRTPVVGLGIVPRPLSFESMSLLGLVSSMRELSHPNRGAPVAKFE